MVEVEYLSISEFAEKAGVSKQAIYKQANNDNSKLSKYLLREGKKILIQSLALVELYGVDLNSINLSTCGEGKETTFTTEKVDFKPANSTQRQPNNSTIPANSTQEMQPISTDYIEYLKAQISDLKEEKAQVEERLTATIKEKDDIIKQQTEQLANLAQQVAQIADKALITTSQQQFLTAVEKNDKIDTALTDGKPIEAKQKKGLWRRFFD